MVLLALTVITIRLGVSNLYFVHLHVMGHISQFSLVFPHVRFYRQYVCGAGCIGGSSR